MSFCTTAKDGLPSKSAVVEKPVTKGERPSAADQAGTGLAGAIDELTKHLDEPLCGLEELERVDAVVLDGHVDKRLWAGGLSVRPRAKLGGRRGARTLLTVSK
jgi:hypothetical protein